MAADQPSPLDQRRFLFVTGKGGTGKTSVCAAVALALAQRGRRVLVAQCGVHERLSAILGTPPIGHELANLRENIWATKIDADRAMQEYGEIVIKVKTVARAAFESRYVKGFLRAVPGLHDWAMLGKAWYHTTELRDDGSPRFHTVLFDAPSTGHGLDMLRVPRVILDIVPPGVLRRDAEKAWALFRDPQRSGVVVVTLAEEMPATETIELMAALHELGLPPLRLVINQVLDPRFSEEQRRALGAHRDLLDPKLVTATGADYEGPLSSRSAGAAAAGNAALAAGARRAAREQLQRDNVMRLERELGMRPTVLPFLLDGAGTPQAAQLLAQRF
jgi:anion-transporting  ArsA/GET3 family ATPase